MPLIRKVLIANRGEIACRVIRTCRARGIATVAVFSDADAHACHVHEADEAVRLGPSPASASYLNGDALLAAAQRTGADAIHPGYGFLAEHAPFAAACQLAGLIFIGPEPAVIASMGSKRAARQMMAAAGVPVIPGYDGSDQTDERFRAAARDIGYPVMVKASAGGGGKGMRVVQAPRDLPAALAAARREAQAAFGDATLLLERALDSPRHIEFQIFGDTNGALIQLGERECSIQRRHQKIVEETPSTALTPALRARMAEAALVVGRQLAYTNAGTVEFILDGAGDFYFLEVNTRLQVEHPITELVTGLDLVAWQIAVAQGEPLPMAQHEVRTQGHAVEVRLYAEDPARDFVPATGTIARWEAPTGDGIRTEAGIQTGDDVSPYYDPLLAKICAHGATRGEALRRLDHALGATTLLGVRTNLVYLRRLLAHPAHVAGLLSTGFVAQHAAQLHAPPDAERVVTAAVAVTLWRQSTARATLTPPGWRNNPGQAPLERYLLPTPRGPGAPDGPAPAEMEIGVRVLPPKPGGEAGAAALAVATIAPDGIERTYAARIQRRDAAGNLDLELDGRLLHATIAAGTGEAAHEWWVKLGDTTLVLRWLPPLPEPSESRFRAASGIHQTSLQAPMPGQVVAVLVSEGQEVAAGEALLILEAMKMEQVIAAPHAGMVRAIHFAVGERVPAGGTLVDLATEPPHSPANRSVSGTG